MVKNNSYYYETQVSGLAGAIHRELSNKLVKMFSGSKLAISHIVILELLNEKKSSNMSDLSKSLSLTMSAATAVIDKMVEFGLVKREHSAKDRRIVDVSLTKKGKDAAGKVIKNRHDMIKEVFSVISKQEKKQYLGLLKKIYTGLKRKK